MGCGEEKDGATLFDDLLPGRIVLVIGMAKNLFDQEAAQTVGDPDDRPFADVIDFEDGEHFSGSIDQGQGRPQPSGGFCLILQAVDTDRLISRRQPVGPGILGIMSLGLPSFEGIPA